MNYRNDKNLYFDKYYIEFSYNYLKLYGCINKKQECVFIIHIVLIICIKCNSKFKIIDNMVFQHIEKLLLI
jgi:hypothetical protein